MRTKSKPSIKIKLTDFVLGSIFRLGYYVMNWLEKPEVDAVINAAERRRKRRQAFRSAQRQPDFVIDNGHRRRQTDIHD